MRRTAIVSLSAVLLPLVLAGPAVAVPSCTGGVPLAACGGRVVAEPELSVAFHQFDSPVESLAASLKAIEARSPRFITAKPIHEWTGDDSHRSLGRRDLWVVRITDTDVEGPKKQVAASLSVHGLEAAGREGGLRYIEDLAIWTAELAAGGEDRLLYTGDVARPLSQVMAETESWFAFTNPDGWAQGDLFSADTSPGFQRGNQSGQDLNRDYPTVGWMARGARTVAASEPETRGWIALVEGLDHLTTSTDIHGELTTPNDAFADLIIPAGQWTPKRQAQVAQLGNHMIGTIERKFAEEGVVLDEVFGPLPPFDGATPRKPANVAAAYDIVGYDDSGFMGDWFSQRQDSVHMDVENFLSNLAPNNGYSGLVEQAHVAAVRGILEATVVEAMVTHEVEPDLDLQQVAYVLDPNHTLSDDADGRGPGDQVVDGEVAVKYDASRMEYFEELEKASGKKVDPVTAEDVARSGVPAKYDTLVVADMELPAGSTADREDYVAALHSFADKGGQLLLTDRALGLLDDLGVVETEALTVNRTDAGHVDFAAPLDDHPYEDGLVGKPSQTYYEVMLGYPGRGSAPNYGIERGAWEKAGGTTVATVGDQGASTSPNTALGHIPLGKGQVAVFGAVLPQAIEELVRENGQRTETPHPFGLADYAVTITGGQVLDNVLSYDRKEGLQVSGEAVVVVEDRSLLGRLGAKASALRPDVLWRKLTQGANR